MEFKYHNQGFEADRNKKMIHLLSQKSSDGMYSCKGTFLFGIYGNNEPVCITPPGLTDKEAQELCKEFFDLFGKYAKKWAERQKIK